jgi:hypothetical protein
MHRIEGHCIVVGETMSGKTRIVKQIVRQNKRDGVPLLVLTPFYQDPEWEADFITDDPQLFYQAVFKNVRCNVVIDEAGEMIGQHGKEMNAIATRGRHHGHRVWIIAQRYKMVDISTRTQCNNLIAFRCGKYDAKQMHEDFYCDRILQTVDLKKGQCLVKLKDRESFIITPF